ncbi:MAG: mechanosensitive ion channel family protein [Oscillospiraceae bacterium]
MDFSALASIKIGSLTVGRLCSTLLLALVCLVIIRLLLHLLRKGIARSKLDERVKKYVTDVLKILLYIVGTLIVVESLGVKITSIVAALSVCGLAVSLAVEGVLSNMAGGIVILVSHPFNLGDFIEASGVSGTVAEISLSYTKLDTTDGRRVLLPNKALSASQMINYTTLGRRRVEHLITASYDAPPETVRAALLLAATGRTDILADPAPEAEIEKYGDSAIQYSLRCWTTPEDYWTVYYALLTAIHQRFDQAGISMTYPHLNVHLVEKP